MNISTTLNQGQYLSNETDQYTANYPSSDTIINNNNSKISNFPHKMVQQHGFLPKNTDIDQRGENDDENYAELLATDDILLLKQLSGARTTTSVLHKSSSYSGTIKPKGTILKQDSLNGRVATTLADGEDFQMTLVKGYCSAPPIYTVGEGTEENDSFLVCTTSTTSSSSSSNATRRDDSRRIHGRSHSSFCLRALAFIKRNSFLGYLVPLSILIALMVVGYLTRDYVARLLYWIETQNSWVIFIVFMALFVLVSFPVVVGYFVLMITSGYLFGWLRGIATVILGANVGIAIAHVTIKSCRHRIPLHRFIKNETGRAILRVISGPKAFKVVLFTRLTPIPFGVQNAIFGISTIKPRIYHSATFLGLLPAQIINVYLGSTLRSMHDVLNNQGIALTGYFSFAIEVVCGLVLMFWVVHKARKELSETLLLDISNEGKLIDIQV